MFTKRTGRTYPSYLNYDFKYKMTYILLSRLDIYYVYQKNYDELNAINQPLQKTKLCSTITSKFNPGGGLYAARIEFIKKLSKQKQFLDKVDIFGYNWDKIELGEMFKGTFGGFNLGGANKIDNLLPNTTKWDGLEKYKYSISIENSCKENYFSEKFTDCILSMDRSNLLWLPKY